MYITREEVEKILAVIKEFPDARSYKLESDSSSGIGSMLTLEMDIDIKHRPVTVKIEISGVENW